MDVVRFSSMRTYCIFVVFVLLLCSWVQRISSNMICPAYREQLEDDLIVGGEIAIRHEFPYQLLLHIIRPTRRGICGASIIGPFWALTAAHCVYNNPPFPLENITVGVGYHSRDDFDGTEYNVRVAAVIIHPFFDITTARYDIALIQVSTPFLDRPVSQPVALASPLQDFPPGLATVTGWGTTEDGSTTVSRVLRKVDVTVYEDYFCERAYDWYDKNIDLCAGALEGGKGICRGDSGGPLVLNGFQIGIAAASGGGCSLPNRPNVYTRVSAFRPWITSVAGL